ncbi:MAG: hypothetical protein IJ538_02055 [Clostridia bacterium]|nr:hypothetical protein [Clostridia bacterium]
MKSSALKLLAQKAKKRLASAGKTNEQIEEKQTHAYLSPTTYKIVAGKQKIEDDPLYDKVKKILDTNPDKINPLHDLTDKKFFDSLTQTEKEMYIIDISKRYNRIREYYLSNKLDG